ncbi:hypothetical protein QQS21_008151 [Conoideocrella luteorostrata]|uniref:NB-ARC domain-containing protein n=1 Tax=Conoideocrella luteorostrata TaxID=1105319 RepID=A0AAJ0CK99_9HYPO|nr:hypothetical protein QQS21_008151 [Conoideocrella luteorostrata]
MAHIIRTGFSQLSLSANSQAVDYKANVIFIHGLRGHPKHTWDAVEQANEASQSASSSRPKPWRAKFRDKKLSDNNLKPGDVESTRIFWPEDYLAEDVPNARIWTYGFDANVINGLFKPNNQNSISQHGQDLAVRFQRHLDNPVQLIVVGDFSSKLGLPLETVESIDADHMAIAKCTSRLDPRYLAISGVIKGYVRAIAEKNDTIERPIRARRNDTAPVGKFSVPFPRNPNFVSRDTDLSFILGNVQDAVKSQKTFLIHGIGGVGKTQLALEFAYRFQDKFRYVFWLSAQNEATISAAYNNMAMSLSLQSPESRRNALTIERVRQWLCENSDWLLLFDNVEGRPSDLNQFWPPCHHGSIILTSQRSDLSLRTTSHLNLHPLNVEEGSELLLRYLPEEAGSTQIKLVKELCQEVDCLPLLLVALGGFISQSYMHTALPDILRSLSSRVSAHHILSDPSTRSAAFQYEKPVSRVFRLALDKLPTAAQNVFNIMAMLSPEDIMESIFFHPTSVSFLDPSLLSDKILFAKMVRQHLSARHLTEIRPKSSGVVYSVHRSVQREVLNLLEKEDSKLELVFNQAVGLIHAHLPIPSPIMVPLFEFHRYIPFIAHVMNICKVYTQSQPNINPTIQFAEMICSAIAYLYESGLSQSCLDLATTGEDVCQRLSEAIVTSKQLAPSEDLALDPRLTLPRLQANILAYGAGVLWTTGGIKNRHKAHEMGERITKLRDAYMSEANHNQVDVRDYVLQANAYNDWALQLINEGYYTQARLFSQQSLETKQRLLRNDKQQFEFYSSKIHLAVIFLAENAPIKALAMAKEAISHVEMEKGPDHSYTRFCKFHVANVYASVGKYAKAVEMQKTVLDARIGMFGEAHNDTLNAYYALAFCQYRCGDFNEASRNVSFCVEKSQAAQWAEECVLRAKYLESLVKSTFDDKAKWEDQRKKTVSRRDILLHHFADGNWALPVDGKDEFIYFDYLVNYSAGRIMIMQLDNE